MTLDSAMSNRVRFLGCIFDPASDIPENSGMLTDEQTEEFAAIIYQSFKRWYGR